MLALFSHNIQRFHQQMQNVIGIGFMHDVNHIVNAHCNTILVIFI